MKQYEQRLTRDLSEIQKRVVNVGRRVGRALDEAVKGVVSFNKEQLNQVMLHDHPINRETRAIDQLCHSFVARHLPAARHLRFVSSVLRLTVAIERIGDYAVTLGRVSVRLSQPLHKDTLAHVQAMGDRAIQMLSDALDAFEGGDVSQARTTKKIAKEIDELHDTLFTEVMAAGDERTLREVVSVVTILSHIERVSDQAKNICEEVLFVETGETKQPKTYRILFVDETNSLISPLACAIAEKAFPESGRYASAGWAPSGEFHPALDRISDSLGLDISDTGPTILQEMTGPSPYHVIVLLRPDESEVLPEIPFHTIVLRWSLGPSPEGGKESFDTRLEQMARDLSVRIQELMVTLRGDDAR